MNSNTSRTWLVGIILAVLLGAFLRLIWVGDMEYKREEAWTFERTQKIGQEPFPMLGMSNSVEMRHPGMSVWVFLGLAQIFRVDDPVDLTFACNLLNVAALVLLAVFIATMVPAGEREPWCWALALASVNPLAVLFQRKIWPPSLLPFFSMLFLMAWWKRERRIGAFLWGTIGALLGQINPVGFFFAGGFFLWTLIFQRRRVAWFSWFLGSCLGSLTLIPWLHYVATQAQGRPHSPHQWVHIVEGKFWTRWTTEALGVSLHYALEEDFTDFLRRPTILGRPTYGVAVLHIVIIGAGAIVLVLGLRRLWRERGRLWSLWIGRDSDSAFALSAGLWGFGILFTLTCLPIHRHYMIVVFPLIFLWIARFALLSDAPRLGRILLVLLCLSQAAISASFLRYVHREQRLIRGDYGLPYSSQTPLTGQLPAP